MKRLALVLPVVLLAAACGGSGKAGSSGSKADYVAKAEAICKKVNADYAKLTFPSTAQAFPTYVQDLLTLAEKAAHDLEALTPPAADRAELQSKVLTPLEGQITLGKTYLDKVKAAAAANDQKQLGQLLAAPPSGAKPDTAWMRSYGFDECLKAAAARG